MKKGLGIFNRRTRRKRPAQSSAHKRDTFRRDDYYRDDEADYSDEAEYGDDAYYGDDADYDEADLPEGDDFDDEDDYDDEEFEREYGEDYSDEESEEEDGGDYSDEEPEQEAIEGYSAEEPEQEAIEGYSDEEPEQEAAAKYNAVEGSNVIHAVFGDAHQENSAGSEDAVQSDEDYREEGEYYDETDSWDGEEVGREADKASGEDEYFDETDTWDGEEVDRASEEEYRDDEGYAEEDEYTDDDEDEDRYAAAASYGAGRNFRGSDSKPGARGSSSGSASHKSGAGRGAGSYAGRETGRSAGRDAKRDRLRGSGRGGRKGGGPGAGAKVIEFFKNTGAVERIAMVVALLLIIGGVVIATTYSKALDRKNDIDAFAEIGRSLDGTTVIGESGLIAMADAQRARAMAAEMMEEQEEEQQEEVVEEVKAVDIKVTLTSIKSDIKVKFVNQDTKKLVGDVHFEIEVVTPDGTKVTYDDHDKDGIIYKKDLTAGKYKITPKALSSEYKDKYNLDTSTQSLTVKDTVEMKAVDVSDEIKKESQVNAAVEDTAEKTAIESQLTDTVEWIESNQNSSGNSQEQYKYEEINRSDIPDPYKTGKANGTDIYTAARTKSVTATMTMGKAEEGVQGASLSKEPSSEESSTEGSSTAPENNDDDDEEQEEELLNMGLDASSFDLKVGETRRISVSGPSSPSFESSNSGIASVSDDGTVKGVSGGSAVITIKASGYNDAKVDVYVEEEETKPEEKKDFRIKVTSFTLKVGDTDKIAIDETPSDIKFESDDSSIVTVSETGTIKAVAQGSAKVKVTASGYNDTTVLVKVEPADVEKETITLNATSITLKVGGTEKITAKGPKSVTFKSAKESIATVGKDGTVKGIAPGTTTITVSAENYKDATVEVKVEGSNKTLKDKNGNIVYVKNDKGEYVEAKYDDYYGKKTLYLRKENKDSGVRYGWWTINGNTYYYDKNGNYVTGEQVIQGAKYYFNSEGVLSSSSGVMGIDVSKWNGNINWSQVKNSGVKFVIIRCGYRGSSAGALIEDPKFRANIQGAQSAGLKVGVYFFTQAVNEVEAVEEASMVISLIKGYSISYPVYLDVEGSGGRGDKISASQRTANIKAFCGTIQNAGYRAGVYANKTWFTSQINTGSLTNYKIWLAQYAASVTYNATRYDMWQYTSKGKISGISGNVDMNISYN